MRFSINAIAYFLVAIFVVVFVLILIVPIGHTGDGWGYAADVMRANSWQSPDLVSAHHLLYNYFCYASKSVFLHCNINPINGFTAINWIFYGFILWILYKTLRALNQNKWASFNWTLLIAGCYGLLRFALENEIYILPLFFALLGSHLVFFLKNKRSKELWGVSCFTIAVLFHQSYIFWLIAFCIHSFYQRRFLVPFLSILTIVLFYLLFAIKQNQSLLGFVLNDANNGLVQLIPDVNNFKFTLINGFRSLFQVHGNMVILFNSWTLLSIIGLSGFALFITVTLRSFLKYNTINELNDRDNKSTKALTHRMSNPFFIAFFLHLAFAFYSVGNAEFMVMLPILFLLSFYDKIIPLFTHIHLMTLGIWIYNIVFYIIPLSSGTFDDIGGTSKLLSKDHPKSPFLLVSSNAVAIHNKLEYDIAVQRYTRSLIENSNNQGDYIKDTNDSSAFSTSQKNVHGEFLIGQNPKEVDRILKAIANQEIEVYTDNTLLFNDLKSTSRAAMLIDPYLKNRLSNCKWIKIQEENFSNPKRKLELYKIVREKK